MPRHGVPSGAGGLEQEPLLGSHVPARWHESTGGQTTGLVPAHVPLMHANVVSQRLLLAHAVPSGTVGLLHWPLVGSQVPATWHESLGAHTTGLDPEHAPLWQVYVVRQGFVPVHAVPSPAVGFEHCPLEGSHVPAEWHWSLAVHVTGLEPVQVPALAGVGLRAGVAVVARGAVRRRRVRARPRAWIARAGGMALVARRAGDGVGAGAGSRPGSCRSACRRCRRCTSCRSPRSGSSTRPCSGCRCPRRGTGRSRCRSRGSTRCRCRSGRCPSACTRCRRCRSCRSPRSGSSTRPCSVLQVPATWHWSLAVQVTGFEPVHVPPWQLSVCVQALPSLHVVPFAAVGFEHAPVLVLHVPATWHWSLAVQVTGFDPVQVPPGRRRSACTRCRRCTSSRSRPSGSSTAPCSGCTCPRRGTDRSPRTSTGARSRCTRPPGTCRLGARVAVVARRAVRGRRVRALPRARVARAGDVALVARGAGDACSRPVHTPAWQVSFSVHALPSLHVVPLAAVGFEHARCSGCRCRRCGTGPPRCTSPGSIPVHDAALAGVGLRAGVAVVACGPVGGLGFEQAPVAGLHVPATWH